MVERERITVREGWTHPLVKVMGPLNKPLTLDCAHRVVVRGVVISWCGECGKRAL